MEYTLIRSERKTIAIQVKADGQVIVRAPRRASMAEIQRFISTKESWIQKNVARMQEERKAKNLVRKLTEDDVHALVKKARKLMPERVQYYAPIVGVNYGRITIRNQKTRWGSCSGKGNLNFNCLLMLMPIEVIDSVVVHELCHLKQMNHSKAFYQEVYRAYPEYDKWNKWLKENGKYIMSRMWD